MGQGAGKAGQRDEAGGDTSDAAPNDPNLDSENLTLALSTRTSGSGAIDRIRSQNGYGVSDEPGDDGEPPGAQPEKDPFEVGWEGGDSDPLCPRSFSKGRKWLIVAIVSMVSLCV